MFKSTTRKDIDKNDDTSRPVATGLGAVTDDTARGAATNSPGRWMARLCVALMLSSVGSQAVAQPHESQVGGYTLRSSVVSSTSIAASTAKAHGITQAPGTSVLNVVVLKHDGQRLESVAAEVDAEVRDLLGASHSIDLKPVRSNGWISYMSSFTHAPAETLNVRVTARPSGGGPPLEVVFRERVGLQGDRS